MPAPQQHTALDTTYLQELLRRKQAQALAAVASARQHQGLPGAPQGAPEGGETGQEGREVQEGLRSWGGPPAPAGGERSWVDKYDVGAEGGRPEGGAEEGGSARF